MHPLSVSSVLFTASVLFSGAASAANTIFTSELTFQAASGATQIESFENLSGSNRSANPIVTSNLTVTPEAAFINIQYAPDGPEFGFGAFPVSGSQYLLSWNPGLPSGTLRFTFTGPTNVFALTLTDAGEAPGTITIRTNAGFFSGSEVSLPTAGGGHGSALFYGLTQDVAFTEAYLTVNIVDEAFGVDKVYISAVPEPAEYALLLSGLALVGAAARRRRKT